MDIWDPKQYEIFREQRARPFWDLLNFLKPINQPRVLDLGCGTGELTQKLHQKVNSAFTLGIDSSENMLKQSNLYKNHNLEFIKNDIRTFKPDEPFDIVFSNAALHWVDHHETLLPKLMGWVSPHGQIAIQMPNNFDHPSHHIASEVAMTLFPDVFTGPAVNPHVLKVEKYAEMLFTNGFKEQECLIKVYVHPMKSGYEVIEWTKGTLLTNYQRKLSKNEFNDFLSAYSKELINAIGEGPYFYGFKRMLIWGSR